MHPIRVYTCEAENHKTEQYRSLGISIAKQKREGAPPRPRAQVRVSASGGRGALARDRKEVSGRPKACVEGHEKEKVHVRGDGCDGARVKCRRLSGSSGLLRNLALWGTSFPPMS